MIACTRKRLRLVGAHDLSGFCCGPGGSGKGCCTSDLPFEDWTSVFGSERLTGALLDRLTHHVVRRLTRPSAMVRLTLEMTGESYRLKTALARKRRSAKSPCETAEAIDPDTGEILNA